MPISEPYFFYVFKPEKLSFDHFCAFLFSTQLKVHVFVPHVVSRSLEQCKNPAGTWLNVSWKSPGNLLGWICRQPVLGFVKVSVWDL